jgi:hypothetical protein
MTRTPTPRCVPQGAPPGAGGDVVAVASPQVSWFAGTLVAAELVKHMLGLPTVDRRVDIDVAGLPAGVVRSPLADPTGTCICHSSVRRRWYRMLYGHPPEPQTASTADPARPAGKVTRSDDGVADTRGATDYLAEEDLEGPGADARISTQSDVAAQYAKHHQRLRDTAARRFPSQSRRPDQRCGQHRLRPPLEPSRQGRAHQQGRELEALPASVPPVG